MGVFDNMRKQYEAIKAAQAAAATPATATPAQPKDVLTTAFGNLDISKAQINADTVGGTLPYAIEFNVGGQDYKYIPKEEIQNGGLQSGKDAYVWNWFLNKDNLSTFSKNASSADMSNTSVAKYLKDNNLGTQGYLVLADKVPFDSQAPQYVPDRTLNGLKNVDGQVVAGLAGGHGNSYLNNAGQVHDPYVESGSLFGISAETINSIAPIAIAFVAPQLGASLVPTLTGVVTAGTEAAVGTAIASTALQVAAGVDPSKALQNAVTTAAVQTGSTSIAKEINTALSTAGQSAEVAAQIKDISNAAGSAIASAATTAARGGSQQDIIDSAVAGAAGSAATTAATIQDIPTPEAKAIGGAVAGALTGGTQGALTSAAAALGGATAAEKASTSVAKPGETSATGVAPATDTSQQVSDLEKVTVTGSREPDLIIPSTSNIKPITVTAPRYQPDITTASYIPSTSGIRGDLGKVVVTGSRYEPEITSPVAPISESQPEVPVEDRTGTPVDQTAGYEPSLTTASKVSRTGGASVTGPSSTLARALQGDFYPTSTTGLTAYRPAGEIESEETGKQRQDVWNEASLRLKDALGI